MSIRPIKWEDDVLAIIDQTLLPGELRFIELSTPEDVWEAIKVLRVRGAPAIGICAAFGVLVFVRGAAPKTTPAGTFPAIARIVSSPSFTALMRNPSSLKKCLKTPVCGL